MEQIKTELIWNNWFYLLKHYPCYRHSLEVLECSFSGVMIGIDGFSIESYFKNVNFLMLIFFENVNLDCMEKNRFEFWCESENWNFWALSVCFAFVLAQKPVFFQGCAASRMLYKRKLFDCKLFFEKVSPYFMEKNRFEFWCGSESWILWALSYNFAFDSAQIMVFLSSLLD